MTVYFAAQTLVLSYTKKTKHVEALWFASISNSILWFTYVKACWRAAMSSCGKLLLLHMLAYGLPFQKQGVMVHVAAGMGFL